MSEVYAADDKGFAVGESTYDPRRLPRHVSVAATVDMSSNGLVFVGNGINSNGDPEGFRVALIAPLD